MWGVPHEACLKSISLKEKYSFLERTQNWKSFLFLLLGRWGGVGGVELGGWVQVSGWQGGAGFFRFV